MPLPVVAPSFQIEATDRIFCMGSCFAAHIGTVLNKLGFDVVTNQENPLMQGDWAGSNHLIRYNVFSILNDLRWAVDPGAVDYDRLFVEEATGLFMDPYGHYHERAHPKEHLQALRQFTRAVTRRLPECRVVLLTLGLIEVWFDEKTQLYTNIQPAKFAMQQETGRFSLHVLSVEEVAGALEEIHALLARFGHPDVRLLVTASPVPLHATFSGQDIFVANMHSKSVQRAAIGEFVQRHDNVDYFPSYETIMLGNADLAWKDDQRHVTDIAVQLIMEQVLRTYAPQRASATETIEKIRRFDEQLNGVGGQFMWDKLSQMGAQLEKQRMELARLAEENSELRRRAEIRAAGDLRAAS